MKTLILALLTCAFCLTLSAQSALTARMPNATPAPSLGAAPAPLDENHIHLMVEQVKEVLNMQRREFRVVLLDQGDNAFAYRRRGLDHVAFDTACLRRILEYTGSSWAVVGVVAHELGHHYYHHLTHPIGAHLQERGADFLTGLALGRLGAPLEAGERLLDYLAKAEDTPSHPGREKRLKALRAGWEQARRESIHLP